MLLLLIVWLLLLLLLAMIVTIVLDVGGLLWCGPVSVHRRSLTLSRSVRQGLVRLATDTVLAKATIVTIRTIHRCRQHTVVLDIDRRTYRG